MTKEIAIKQEFAVMKLNDPAPFIQEAIVESGARIFDLEKVSVPAGGGTIFEVGGQGVAELHVAIVDSKPRMRSFYIHGLDEGDAAGPPDCNSADGRQGFGVRKEGDEPSVQACLTCPLNQFGSGARGRGKRCREFGMAVAFTADSALPVTLQISTTSLKAYRQYGLKLGGLGKTPRGVVTAITLSKQKGKGTPDYSVMQFNLVRDLTAAEGERFATIGKAIGEAFAAE